MELTEARPKVRQTIEICISLSPFSTRRICSRDAKRKQEFSNVIGWQKSSLLRQPITLPDSCFRFATREQICLVENGLKLQPLILFFKIILNQIKKYQRRLAYGG